MRLLIKKLFLLLFPFIIIIPLVNYYVDPGKKFASEAYVKGVSAIMLKGHNVQNVSNYDERLLQKNVLQNQKTAPEIIVVGSSRIMELGMDAFNNSRLKVINCAVSHANIHDLVSIIGITDSLRILPGKFIINVDPYLVSKSGTEEWQNLIKYHNYMVKKINKGQDFPILKVDRFKKIATLFSFDYFKISLGKLFTKTDDRYYDVGKKIPDFGRFADGTICYPDSYAHPADTIKIAMDAKKTAAKEGLEPPDSLNVHLFNRLLTYLATKKIAVELIMIPFHEAFYKQIQLKKNFNFSTYRNLFINIASVHHIPIKGNFNPDVYNLKESDFYDMYHCSRQSVQKVFIGN